MNREDYRPYIEKAMKREAIRRNRPDAQEGPKRDAFEEYRAFLVSELEPAMRRLTDRKLKEVAQRHGVKEGQILMMMQNPPVGESRQSLLNYVYELLMG